MIKTVKPINCDHFVKKGRVIRNFKVSICSFLVGIFLSMGALVAYAGVANSVYVSYGPVLGYTYKNQASISTGGSSAAAYTWVQNYNYANVPTGYMGAKAMMYNSAGTLVTYSDYLYNSSPSYGFNQMITRSASGTYYSKGLTQAWNGSSYYTYNTAQSPNQNQ